VRGGDGGSGLCVCVCVCLCWGGGVWGFRVEWGLGEGLTESVWVGVCVCVCVWMGWGGVVACPHLFDSTP
jgi:hypothetical protein